MPTKEQEYNQSRQNYIVTGGGETINVLCTNSQTAIKCFRDAYPQVNSHHLTVTTYQ